MIISNKYYLSKSVASKLALWEIEKELYRMKENYLQEWKCVLGMIRKCDKKKIVQTNLCFNLTPYFYNILRFGGMPSCLQHSKGSIINLSCVSCRELRKATSHNTLWFRSLHNFNAGHYPWCSQSYEYLWCLGGYWCHLCLWEIRCVYTWCFLHDLEKIHEVSNNTTVGSI